MLRVVRPCWYTKTWGLWKTTGRSAAIAPRCARLPCTCNLKILCFPLQVKRMKDLEREKDALWCGLEILEKARFWYLQRLDENRARQDSMESKSGAVSFQEGAAEVREGTLALLRDVCMFSLCLCPVCASECSSQSRDCPTSPPAGSIMPAQVSYPAGERFPGLSYV
uniref:Suppressor APC domain containing 2 n=1 Tax=Salarias fasciatus TaxID=181472 RepID=A0A672GSF0_SALFA